MFDTGLRELEFRPPSGSDWRRSKLRTPPSTRYGALGVHDLLPLVDRGRLSRERLFDIEVVSKVLPFRVNDHVVETLIDWARVPDDPIYRLAFPAKEMLDPADFDEMADLLRSSASKRRIRALAAEIHRRLNPHPSEQRERNVPFMDGEPLNGIQHKYRETVLCFPAHGQTCHAYCTFCFRWAQFVGDREMKMSCSKPLRLFDYLRQHQDVTDLLLTGGDPMIMKTLHLESLILPLLKPELDHVQTIRFGTKALTYWPQRFVTDEDADALLRLIERVVACGHHVAIMAHTNHWCELDNPIAAEAIRRLRNAGAVIRSQGPLLARINDDPDTWARMWRQHVKAGIVPYYMFVERDTGPRRYFEVPLRRARETYRDAISSVSGLARTARGPVMSATQGKVEVLGLIDEDKSAIFLLQYLQARDPALVRKPFLAAGAWDAVWFDELQRIPRDVTEMPPH